MKQNWNCKIALGLVMLVCAGRAPGSVWGTDYFWDYMGYSFAYYDTYAHSYEWPATANEIYNLFGNSNNRFFMTRCYNRRADQGGSGIAFAIFQLGYPGYPFKILGFGETPLGGPLGSEEYLYCIEGLMLESLANNAPCAWVNDYHTLDGGCAMDWNATSRGFLPLTTPELSSRSPVPEPISTVEAAKLARRLNEIVSVKGDIQLQLHDSHNLNYHIEGFSLLLPDIFVARLYVQWLNKLGEGVAFLFTDPNDPTDSPQVLLSVLEDDNFHSFTVNIYWQHDYCHTYLVMARQYSRYSTYLSLGAITQTDMWEPFVVK